MANIIKIKNSNVSRRIPKSTDLVEGELAINFADKRIYTKNSSGQVIHLFPHDVLIDGYQEQSVDLGPTGNKKVNIDGRLYEFSETLTNNVTITVGSKPTHPICASSIIYVMQGGYDVKFVGVSKWAGGEKPNTSSVDALMRYVISTDVNGNVMANGEAFEVV
jgi:hypothetical protein